MRLLILKKYTIAREACKQKRHVTREAHFSLYRLYVVFMYEQCEEPIESTPKNTNFYTPFANTHSNKRFVLLERLSLPKGMQYLTEN